jgi:tetratricopeptide (TPR) repeat protein
MSSAFWNSKAPLSELSHMAAVYRKLGQLQAAENLYNVIIDYLEKEGQIGDQLALALYSLGEVVSDQERFAESIPFYRRAVGIWEQAHPVQTLSVLCYSEALSKMQELIDQQMRHSDSDHSATA